MIDLLGINHEKNLESLILEGKMEEAHNLCAKIWEKEKIPSFQFWKLLIENKGQEAIGFAKKHVMVRSSPIGVYLAYTYCQDSQKTFEKSFEMPFVITKHEKERLADSSLMFGAKMGDPVFCSRIMEYGANPKAHYHQAFKNACDKGHLEIAKLFINQKSVSPSCEENYAIIAALKNQHMELLKYLENKVDLVPVSWSIITGLVTQQKEGSLKWLCERQTKRPRYTDGYHSLYFNFANAKDCETLVKECLKHPAIQPNAKQEADKKARKVLELLPLDILEKLSKRDHSDAQKLSAKILQLKKNEETVKTIKRLYPEEDLTL
jgi:hypothetical protein